MATFRVIPPRRQSEIWMLHSYVGAYSPKPEPFHCAADANTAAICEAARQPPGVTLTLELALDAHGNAY